jgi:shikimate dehydrogenase
MNKYGLIGKSLSHSFSKSFFTDLFEHRGMSAVYKNVEISSISEIIEVFKEDWKGLNVTVPYKEMIIPFLDELDKNAEEIGAVNVIQFKGEKKIGYNTDAYGFHQSIKPFLTNQHERALIFGTGGASKAVEHVLKSIGLNVIFISRDPKKTNHFHYNEVNELMLNACKLLVNCTPLGTYPNFEEVVDIPFDFITKDHLVVDLIYNPSKTRFLEEAESRGATIVNGETMLKQQALKALSIWQDV